MQTDGGRLSWPTRHGTVRGPARDSQPQTQIDEQPTGSLPGGREDAVLALCARHVGSRPGASPNLGVPVSAQGFKNRGVIHDPPL